MACSQKPTSIIHPIFCLAITGPRVRSDQFHYRAIILREAREAQTARLPLMISADASTQLLQPGLQLDGGGSWTPLRAGRPTRIAAQPSSAPFHGTSSSSSISSNSRRSSSSGSGGSGSRPGAWAGERSMKTSIWSLLPASRLSAQNKPGSRGSW